MAQSEIAVSIRIRVAWWLRWYLAGVVLMCKSTGCRPDMDKVEYWVSRAIKLRTEP